MGTAPRFVFASDSFKGTLSSADTARLLEAASRASFPNCSCTSVPMADGGEGTVEALIAACGGRLRTVSVEDPLGRALDASYGLLGEGRAVIEMAAASGLPLLATGERNPLATSTFGTGELVADALAQGCRSVALAIGGSATNDGGMGFLRALGVRFLDEQGFELKGCGADLARVRNVDAQGLAPALRPVELRVMCDVDNPLLGENGCAHVFAAQKGADADMIEELERGMENYALVMEDAFGRSLDVPGAGAAGGLGAACLALGAELVSGIDCVLELAGFEGVLEGADLCVTGEGRYDAQTARGKVIKGVAAACERADVPCVAIVGSAEQDAVLLPGLSKLIATAKPGMPLEEALSRAEELYAEAANAFFSQLSL